MAADDPAGTEHPAATTGRRGAAGGAAAESFARRWRQASRGLVRVTADTVLINPTHPDLAAALKAAVHPDRPPPSYPALIAAVHAAPPGQRRAAADRPGPARGRLRPARRALSVAVVAALLHDAAITIDTDPARQVAGQLSSAATPAHGLYGLIHAAHHAGLPIHNGIREVQARHQRRR